MIEEILRSLAARLDRPGMQGAAFTWLDSFPIIGSGWVRTQLDLGNFKTHLRHLEEADALCAQIAQEYHDRSKP